MPPGNECGWADVGCRFGEAGQAGVGAVLNILTEEFDQAITKNITALTTFWVNIPTPAITPGEGVTGFLSEFLAPITGVFLVLSLVIASIRILAVWRKGAAAEAVDGMVTFALISAFGILTINILAVAADEFAVSIVDASTDGGDLGTNLVALMSIGAAGSPVFGFFGTMLLAILAVPAAWIQAMILILRAILLPILAALLPLSAVFFTSPTGKAWLQRHIIWIVGFLAYKPAAALMYASAFYLAGSDDVLSATNVTEYGIALLKTMMGLALILLNIFMLPALIAFAVPVAGKIGGAVGGGGAGYLGAAVGMSAAAGIGSRRPAGAGGSSRMPRHHNPGTGGGGRFGAPTPRPSHPAGTGARGSGGAGGSRVRHAGGGAAAAAGKSSHVGLAVQTLDRATRSVKNTTSAAVDGGGNQQQRKGPRS